MINREVPGSGKWIDAEFALSPREVLDPAVEAKLRRLADPHISPEEYVAIQDSLGDPEGGLKAVLEYLGNTEKPRFVHPIKNNASAIAHTQMDYKGDLGGGTPSNALRIGRSRR